MKTLWLAAAQSSIKTEQYSESIPAYILCTHVLVLYTQTANVPLFSCFLYLCFPSQSFSKIMCTFGWKPVYCLFSALWHPADAFSSLKVSCLHSRHVGLLLAAGKQATPLFLITLGWKVHAKWAVEVWWIVTERKQKKTWPCLKSTQGINLFEPFNLPFTAANTIRQNKTRLNNVRVMRDFSHHNRCSGLVNSCLRRAHY